ncbi:gamma-glutamylcyclotransferase-like isoform X2 [Leguminivora glycinivorella]|uniref:gamma-glutamylcyclotransferase-like isoform X2 n=1 Tax=Leguminivora glycinivorella TaxID=1035111 RepID=UPI00200BBF0E|nr:gamma-glutamylcyclotransferase-like isoform X2 [Leguminivora glycinivorella]
MQRDEGHVTRKDFRLDFNMQMESWGGAVATIVPDANKTVWGTLWLIDKDKMKYLDMQEGVDHRSYYATNVTVARSDGYEIQARTYIQTRNPAKIQIRPGEYLPYERLPSSTYMKVIILGAMESGLPSAYVNYLKTFPTNNKKAPFDILRSLGTVTLVNKKIYKFE